MSQWFHFLFFGALATLLFLTGCIVTSEQPLSDPKDARPDPLLVGVWRSVLGSDHSTTRIRFDAQGQGYFEDKTKSGQSKSGSANDKFFVTQTADASYLNMAVAAPDKQGRGAREKPEYQFSKYQVSHDRKKLTLWLPKLAVIRQAVRSGQLKGRIIKTDLPPKTDGTRDDSLDGVVLRDSPAKILRFLNSRPTDELFDVVNVSKKVD